MMSPTHRVQSLVDRVLGGELLQPEQGLWLLEQRDFEVRDRVREGADRLRVALVGDRVTYVINRNINFTNICEQHCSFCAFRRDAQSPGAYWLTLGEILAKATEAVAQGATELCMQGGLNPAAKAVDGLGRSTSLAYYCQLVSQIHDRFPQLHLHAFSPQEVQFIAREDDLDYTHVLRSLREAGVGSLPGTAAEVLDDRVRQILCPEKITSQQWLEIVGLAHDLGLPTTSTMLSGHIETPAQQIHHFDRLRSLQRRAIVSEAPARITEFILLPFVGQDAPASLRRRVGRDQPVAQDALYTTAVARLFFGALIPHHQPSWVKLGLETATEALTWGCNDLGGTLMEEHISTMAGAQGGTAQTVESLRSSIESVGRSPVQRDTLYRHLT